MIRAPLLTPMGASVTGVVTGASLTAVTLSVLTTTLLSASSALPSLIWKLMPRTAVLGLSLVLEYCTARRAACHWARVAVAPTDASVMTPACES